VVNDGFTWISVFVYILCAYLFLDNGGFTRIPEFIHILCVNLFLDNDGFIRIPVFIYRSFVQICFWLMMFSLGPLCLFIFCCRSIMDLLLVNGEDYNSLPWVAAFEEIYAGDFVLKG
jgi:hypothetical protein